MLDPCASIEFSRGCPWDCSFCSAWTFYGRSYRLVSPERVVEDLRAIREPGVFIVDDVAFIHERHGFEIGEAMARAGIRKQLLPRDPRRRAAAQQGRIPLLEDARPAYMFLGLEAIDEEGLKKYRKRVPLGRNFEALEFARSLGIDLAINLIADPDWDRERFRVLREWCLEQPEIVNISVNTPYPGTESWLTEERRLQTRDYRLFDIQHAVLPTRLPLAEFYEELVDDPAGALRASTWAGAAPGTCSASRRRLLLRGQTNFVKSLFKFNSVYRPDLLLADHARPVAYEIPLPPQATHAAAGARPRPLRACAARPRRPGDRRRDGGLCRRDAHGRLTVSPVPTGTAGTCGAYCGGAQRFPDSPDSGSRGNS